ncbi:MAG: glycosyltransferase family 2 protein [candidate division KSB1 bacterium]|nr:glycosyltransferase family 2 protein [candidate division KSB1 bacterium]MDZ7273486.1 glycosyltransferase family 2 protein [candidate division KSB1 bacterium]MDZ7286922.1 glycosyltransferase family 2 protein [candidate division KSB1 bacterium]MDZ7299725.1 glycosyltransferase family 2 protein [candidate division KSB1 bacterium]MDZ7305664.1 glycosyltransferase family 2 protein [candidate division KSB1 bacterium]
MPPPDHLAVIIVTYQSAAHIGACLASLPAAEPRRRLTIHLIDNASTDNTMEIVAQAVRELPAPRVVVHMVRNPDNVGFTAALNQGLALCPREAPILFLNPDTVLPPASLARLLDELYKHDRVGVMAPQLHYLRASPRAGTALPAFSDATIQPSCRRFPRYTDLLFEFTGLSRAFPGSRRCNRWKMGDFDHRSSAAVEQPQGACLLARPQVVQALGRWDERFPLFFSDVDWCRRVWQAGWQIRFTAQVKVFHALGASVKQVRPAAVWSSHVSFWRYFWKYRRSPLEAFWLILLAPLFLFTAVLRIAGYLLATPLRRRNMIP